MRCELEHSKNHNIILYKKIIPNITSVKNKIKELKNIIDGFNNNINDIINILQNIKKNIEQYFTINNNILNHYDIKK